MTDATPQERAANIRLGDPREIEEGAVRQWVEDEIRAAVAAERERCARIDPYSVPCPVCKEEGDPCIYVNPHPERIAAAIREEPADD